MLRSGLEFSWLEWMDLCLVCGGFYRGEEMNFLMFENSIWPRLMEVERRNRTGGDFSRSDMVKLSAAVMSRRRIKHGVGKLLWFGHFVVRKVMKKHGSHGSFTQTADRVLFYGSGRQIPNPHDQLF
jgi:hypothetical protein